MNVRSKTAPADKREAILSAALDLFAERGFHGTAIPMVAERARVSTGTIYHYFESKEAIGNELFRQCKIALASALQVEQLAYGSPRQQFHVLFTRAAAFVKEHPKALAFLECHDHSSYLDRRSRTLEAQLRQPIEAYFRRAIQQEAVKSLPPLLLLSMVWPPLVALTRASWSGEVELTPAVLQQVEDCCWEAIRR
jgi:AcrR family transcriptional regulator